MQKILFMYNTKGPWVKADLEILKGAGVVEECPVHKLSTLNYRKFFQIAKADTVYCWFGSLSFLPFLVFAKLLSKKIVIVAGGFDVVSFPAYSYGAFAGSLIKKNLRRHLFSLATQIVFVSQALKGEASKYLGDLVEKSPVVHLALPDQLDVSGLFEKDKGAHAVVMIANIDEIRFKLKGFDLFVELARAVPSRTFYHIGFMPDECLPLNLPKNLTLCGRLDVFGAEYLGLMRKCKVAVQLSVFESFCMSIVEAGLCGCMPIVFSAGALPEVVAEAGVVVPYGDLPSIARELNKIEGPHLAPREISDYFGSRFSWKSRKSRLRGLLTN